jgi:hypothetical protein
METLWNSKYLLSCDEKILKAIEKKVKTLHQDKYPLTFTLNMPRPSIEYMEFSDSFRTNANHDSRLFGPTRVEVSIIPNVAIFRNVEDGLAAKGTCPRLHSEPVCQRSLPKTTSNLTHKSILGPTSISVIPKSDNRIEGTASPGSFILTSKSRDFLAGHSHFAKNTRPKARTSQRERKRIDRENKILQVTEQQLNHTSKQSGPYCWSQKSTVDSILIPK